MRPPLDDCQVNVFRLIAVDEIPGAERRAHSTAAFPHVAAVAVESRKRHHAARGSGRIAERGVALVGRRRNAARHEGVNRYVKKTAEKLAWGACIRHIRLYFASCCAGERRFLGLRDSRRERGAERGPLYHFARGDQSIQTFHPPSLGLEIDLIPGLNIGCTDKRHAVVLEQSRNLRALLLQHAVNLRLQKMIAFAHSSGDVVLKNQRFEFVRVGDRRYRQGNRRTMREVAGEWPPHRGDVDLALLDRFAMRAGGLGSL